MSLFNICTCWSTQCADMDDNYDAASLLCARFGLEEEEKDYIIVASQAGSLSIFYPTFEFEEQQNENFFKPTDLLLEILLPAPILGVYSGRFSSNIRTENSNHLAVLHPFSLAIYDIKTLTGVAEHGTQVRLQMVNEHKFERCAYSFCQGHFGQVKGREFYCIVHLDGTLTFYEQDGIQYECQFPGQRALPTPVVYCERTDSFFRFAAEWHLECFTYQDLVHSAINNSEYQPVWSICIGEGIMDIKVVQATEHSASIMILGEHNFMCLHDNGKLNFILKLDYAPKCFYSFVIGYYWEPSARLITAICSHDSKLYIYENASIIWASKCQFDPPVALLRSNLIGLTGSIVTLTDTGLLRIGYLGSEPYVFKPPPVHLGELGFAQAQKELQQLEEEIRAAVDIRDMAAINQRAAEDVQVTFMIRAEAIEDTDTLLLDIPADVAVKELPSAAGTLKIVCSVELMELQVTLVMADGIKCNHDTLTYVNVAAGTTHILELDFYIAELYHIHSAKIDVIISFINMKGIPRVLQQSSYLPLTMFFKVRQPQKVASIKITYNITTPELEPKLATFFPEFVNWESNAQGLGLLLLCPGDESKQEIVTVLTGKASNRIRVQSEHLESVPLLLERIASKMASQSEQKFEHKSKHKQQLNSRVQHMCVALQFPVQEILHRIDVHHETQENIRKQMLELDSLYNQFRELQIKLQDNPEGEPREALVLQVEENYDHLIAEGDKLMDMRKEERKQRCDLTCAIVVAKWLIRYLPIEEKIVNIVLSVMSSPVEDWTELSWEETMSPGIDMLHHYGPLRRANPDAKAPPPPEPNSTFEQFDYTRFRRHFTQIFDNLLKLAHQTDNPTTTVAGNTKNTNAESLSQSTASTTAKSPIEGLEKLLHSINTTESGPLKLRTIKPTTLEAVEDDENEYDEDDLREVGYKKSYTSAERKQHSAGSEWVNESFDLPTAEALFSDLGIWW